MECGRPKGISVTHHVAAIPYPGRGHVNPIMNLSRLLASKGLLVTVVVTEEWHGLLGSAAPLPPNLRLRSIPDVLPSERIRGNDYLGFLRVVNSKMEGPVEALLGGLEPPVDCIVADSELAWAAEIAARMGVPVSALWTESATSFLARYTLGKLDDACEQLPVDLSGKENEPLAYLPRVSTHHFASLLCNNSSLQILRIFQSTFTWITKAQSCLFTSFYELESQAMDSLKIQLPVPIYPLGPSIPYMTLCDSTATCSYLDWLDSQPESSVLYVSLGSFLPISGPQMDEMEAGLHESGVRFLWVIRGELESTKGSGLVVPWCDQLRVLCHPSVGGFVTHCGWNSTLEGVFSGVPMLTWPLFWDQYSSNKLIVDDWKVGLRLKDEKEEEQVVGREKIARMVKELMDLNAEESKEPRRRVADLKEMSRKALEEGGSSSTNLDTFVEGIISQKKQVSMLN